jgi:hypothetical protein
MPDVSNRVGHFCLPQGNKSQTETLTVRSEQEPDRPAGP